MTETNLVNLRRTIYLTIMSSMNFEEAGHKLLKLRLQPGQEVELCSMLCECCSQEKTYLRYYALLAQRFALRFRHYRCVCPCVLRKVVAPSDLKLVYSALLCASATTGACPVSITAQ